MESDLWGCFSALDVLGGVFGGCFSTLDSTAAPRRLFLPLTVSGFRGSARRLQPSTPGLKVKPNYTPLRF